MAFYRYTGTGSALVPATYAALGISVKFGDIVDFGTGTPPDALWSSDRGPATYRAGHCSGLSTARPSAVAYGEGRWFNVDTRSEDYSNGAQWTPVTSKRTGVGGTGMIPCGTGNHAYPVPSSGSLNANGGVIGRRWGVVVGNYSEVRLKIANRYFTSVEPVEVDGPNTVVQRHSLQYPIGVMRYTTGSTAWSAATAYVVGDEVTLAGNSYVCLVNNTNSTPVIGGTANWVQSGFYPFHFAGEGANRDVTLQPGQSLISEAIPVVLTNGTAFGLWAMVQPNNGTANTGSYPTGNALQAFQKDWYKSAITGAAPADFTTVGPTNVATDSTAQNDGSGMLIGKPSGSTGYLGFVADSLGAGSGDTNLFIDNEPGGWMIRAINRQYPHIRIAHTGDTLAGYARGFTANHRRAFLGEPSVYFSELVTNDLGTKTFAQIQALKLAEWNERAARGAAVYAVTVQPRTTSSDSFATTGNQTDVSGWGPGSNRDAYNDWLKTVPSPLAGVLDICPPIETAPKSNRWRNVGNGDGAVFTADGTHPNPFGIAAILLVAAPYFAALPV